MQFALFTLVIAEHLLVSVFDSNKLKLLQVFFNLLPRCRNTRWKAVEQKVLLQLSFKKHQSCLASQFIGNDLVRLPTVVFTCVGMMNTVFCTEAVREGKSSPLIMGVDFFRRGNTSRINGPIDLSLFHKHWTPIL